jgi:GT2 family glycosyltransferase
MGRRYLRQIFEHDPRTFYPGALGLSLFGPRIYGSVYNQYKMDNRDVTTRGTEVGVVVVNWNNYQDTARCLNSLVDLSYPAYQVTVVDNGSTDGSGERIDEEFEWCEVVFNECNRGFGGGCNTGIENALAADVDFVFLLNNDAIVAPDTLDELVAVAMESGTRIVGASIRHGSEEIINSAPSKYPDMFFYSGYRDNLPVDLSRTPPGEGGWIETDRIEGGGVLLASDLLYERREAVGYYLDDSLFMYCEEIELAMWCRERGERAVIATDAIVQHGTGASSSRDFQLYYLTRNRVLIAHRYLQGLSRLLFDVLYPVTRLLLAGRFSKRGRRDVARAVFEGLLDGYRGIEGKTW